MSDANLVQIRGFVPGDGPELFAIFYDAVRAGTHRHYSPEQAAAWAPELPAPGGAQTRAWTARIGATHCFVADVDGARAGFMSLTNAGHIDLAFVRPRWMGGNVAAHLYDHLFEQARTFGFTRLTTDASHLFRAFLLRRGWQGDTQEIVKRNGVDIPRWPMFFDI